MSSEVPAHRESGSVVEFDAHIGLGRIRTDGGEILLFHCAEIADGSRQIDIDRRVSFVIRRKFANPEAFAIEPQ